MGDDISHGFDLHFLMVSDVEYLFLCLEIKSLLKALQVQPELKNSDINLTPSSLKPPLLFPYSPVSGASAGGSM